MSAAMSAGAARATSILQHSLSSLKLTSLTKRASEVKEAPAGRSSKCTPAFRTADLRDSTASDSNGNLW